jgi:hypothetical protein
MHNAQPTTDMKVEAEKQNNVAVLQCWVTLCNAHSKKHGMGWRGTQEILVLTKSHEKFEEKLSSEYISFKSYLAGQKKAYGVTPNIHKQKSKKDNQFRKRVMQWEPFHSVI